MTSTRFKSPNHPLQRGRPSRRGCNPTPSWAGSLILALAMDRKTNILSAVLVCLLAVGCSPSPYYGARWDQVSSPISGTNTMAAVNAFVLTNGWQMQTGDVMFFSIPAERLKPLVGIPWNGLANAQYSAITCDGILYIPLRAFGPESDGIAYRPGTNPFPRTISGSAPLGGNWYAWKQTMSP